jgi:hypothetical protein
MPVANGIMPRPQGGKIRGMFIGGQVECVLSEMDRQQEILVCPWLEREGGLYPVGVLARVVELSQETAADENGNQLKLLLVTLEGTDHARWKTYNTSKSCIFSGDIERLNLKIMRKDYPCISGAGWVPAGGYTEFRGKLDIPVTVYGDDLETGQKIEISANLGGLVTQEQAHTLEHAIIRALKYCGLCTPRTLLQAVIQEAEELKQSVEAGIRFTLPEVLGRTKSGMCGNPMTQLAQFYLNDQFEENLEAGKSLGRSLAEARRSAMSQLTQDIGLTTRPGLRVLQGLKKGMSHDDTILKLEIYKKVIGRFPRDPWS